MDPGPPPGYMHSRASQSSNVISGGVSLPGLISLCSHLSRSQVSTAGMTIDSFATSLRQITDSESLQDDMMEGFDRDGLGSPQEDPTVGMYFLPGLSKGLNRGISQFIGKANRYVIFSRFAPFEELLAALTNHCDEAGRESTQIYFWIQFLSSNSSSQTEIAETIERDISTISYTILVLTSGDINASFGNSSPLTRTFNLLELALSSKCDFFDIVMPRTVRLLLNQRMLNDFSSTIERLFKVNIRSSSAIHGLDSNSDCRRSRGGLCASVLRGESHVCPGDREKIIKNLENIGGGGDGSLDRSQFMISTLLTTWLVSRSVPSLSMSSLTEGAPLAARNIYEIARLEESEIFEKEQEEYEGDLLAYSQQSFRFPLALSRVLLHQEVVQSSRAYEEARNTRLQIELEINLLSIRRNLGIVTKKKFSTPNEIPIQLCENFFGGPTHCLTMSVQRSQALNNTNVHTNLDAYESCLRKYTNVIESISQVHLSKSSRQVLTLPPLVNQDIMRSALEIADIKASDSSSDSLYSLNFSQEIYLEVLKSLSLFGLHDINDEEELVLKATIGLARVRFLLGRLTSSSLLYGKSLALIFSKRGNDYAEKAPLADMNILNTILDFGCVLSDKAIQFSRQALAESATGEKSTDDSAFIDNLVADANDLLLYGIEDLKKRVKCGLINGSRVVEPFEQKLQDLKSRMESSALMKRLHETTIVALSGLGDKAYTDFESPDSTQTRSRTHVDPAALDIETQQLSQVNLSNKLEQTTNTATPSSSSTLLIMSTPTSPRIDLPFEDPDFDARIRGLIVKGLISRSAVELHKVMAKNGNVEAIKWLSEIGKTSLF